MKVELLDTILSNLEVRRKHCCLESTSSRNAVSRVQRSGGFLAEDLLDLLDANRDSGCFSNEFDAVNLLLFET
jgi:hypothetical protein